MTTKFEVLQYYKLQPHKVLSTWIQTGRQKINKDTKFYNNGVVYLLDVSDSPIYNSLVFCDGDFSGQLNWSNCDIDDEELGYLTFGNNIISKNFKIILTFDEVFPYLPIGVENPYDKYTIPDEYRDFIPFENEIKTESNFKISDTDYDLIMTAIGYPFIRQEELEYTKEQIIDLAIKPALDEYFHWVPKGRFEEYTATTKNQYILMPSDCYGVLGISLQQSGVNGVGDVTNPLMFAYQQQLFGGMSASGISGMSYGKRIHTNLNNLGSSLTTRMNQQSLVNYYRRVHYEGIYKLHSESECEKLGFDKSNVGANYIKVYANTNGVLNIWWSVKVDNFDDVDYDNRNRVITLAQDNVKLLFANLRRQSSSTEFSGMYDYDKWISEATDSKNNIIKELQDMVNYRGVIRGSL